MPLRNLCSERVTPENLWKAEYWVKYVLLVLRTLVFEKFPIELLHNRASLCVCIRLLYSLIFFLSCTFKNLIVLVCLFFFSFSQVLIEAESSRKMENTFPNRYSFIFYYKLQGFNEDRG